MTDKPTTSLVTLGDAERVPVRELVKYARAAGMIPPDIRTDEAACGVLLKARELGIPPMAAFGSIHVIEGKPTCSAQLMLACARNRLGDRLLYRVVSAADKCTGQMSTDGGANWNEITITYAEMQAAGYVMAKDKDGKPYTKKSWRNPQAMLRARVISALVRLCVPEATLGTYTPEEVQDAAAEALAVQGARPAQIVAAKLLGVPLPPEPTLDAADPGPPVESAPASAEPPQTPSVDSPDAASAAPAATAGPDAVTDWEQALDAANSRDELARHYRAIRLAAGLDEVQRSALLARAEEIARRNGWTKEPRQPGQEG